MDLQLVIILILIGVVGYLYFRNRQLVVELGQYTSKTHNKQRILEALAAGESLSNEQLRALVGVSARSIVEYMDELEAEGKGVQLGTTGTAVTYRLKP